ncbi:hypothetical protein [uncultured Dysosmobacter sp.]|uniref:hypothetical protein n=1 Tax=uncultured Dysosmobacter sp. TaxID=2591384 RepID=UPI0026120A6E|nr:hypothetical protein [uncultured Dysosmobacter sp.]
MMSSFTNRIEALKERIEQQKAIYAPEYIDPLSQSLRAFYDELAALDEEGIMRQAQKMDCTPDIVRKMAQDHASPVRL